jgi:hypothetical protein
MRRGIAKLVYACALAGLLAPPSAWGQYHGHGSIVGWGEQVVGADLSGGLVAVAGGREHSLGLKSDGSIVAWGRNDDGQCDVPTPNTDFVAVAGGYHHSLGLKGCICGDVDCDGDVDSADLIILLTHYGMTSGATWGDGDLDGDGDVDLADLNTLLGNYGT